MVDKDVEATLSKLRFIHETQSRRLISQVQMLTSLESVMEKERRMNMTIVGIDPGKKGAIVAMIPNDIIMHRMPESAGELVDVLSNYTEAHIFVEKSQAMKGQGVSSMFNYGVGFGTILGVIAALKITHTLVHPKTWCKVMHSGTTNDTAKARSLEAAQRLFPKVQLVRPGCKKPDEGFVDALLICEYGRRFLKE